MSPFRDFLQKAKKKFSRKFPLHIAKGTYVGPGCLQMIAEHYGRECKLEFLAKLCKITENGCSMLDVSDAAEAIGFRTMGVRLDFVKLRDEVLLPCIAHVNESYFTVVYKVASGKVFTADPELGYEEYFEDEFVDAWYQPGKGQGLCLLLEPTPDFYEMINLIKKKKNQENSNW